MRFNAQFVLVVVVAGLVAISPVKAHDDGPRFPNPGGRQLTVDPASECDDACQELLSAVREATAKYHEEWVALADGFRAGGDCVVSAAGLGSGGIHYLNPTRTPNSVVVATEPEILLYEPQKNGSKRLVGVEYWAPVYSNGVPWRGVTAPPTIDNPAPELFGRKMDGPMPGHQAGQPWHYDLHVWLWRHNRDGMFGNFNRRVSCEYGQIRYVD